MKETLGRTSHASFGILGPVSYSCDLIYINCYILPNFGTIV